MSIRNIAPEVTTIFDKYCKSMNRRLDHDLACKMLETEFSLTPDRAQTIFEIFDVDKDNKLNLREFQQFYTTVGKNADAYLDLFERLKVDGQNAVDVAATWDEMKTLPTLSGRTLEDDQLEQCMKLAMGQDERILNLHKFFNLIQRIKLYRN